MSKEAPKQEAKQERARERQPYTHLVGRSNGTRPFTRAGVTFTPELQAWPLSSLDEERVRRIMNEPMVIAQLATEDDIARMDLATRAELDESIPRAALVEHIKHLELRCAKLEEQMTKLQQDRMADRPPRTADVLKQT